MTDLFNDGGRERGAREVRRSRALLTGASSFAMALFAFGLGGAAHAQDPDGPVETIGIGAEPQEEAFFEDDNVITVTGSNVRRKKDFDTPSPVQTLGQTEIQNTGAVKTQDLFKGLTVNSGSQIANRQNALQGVSQFSLRGLGIGSTLTLVNGKRAGLSPVTDESGQLFTDANQFPVNMISRVEVLTDGASATYGSEAVAGVVNIITRTDFEGFELTGEIRDSTHTSYQLGGAFGAQFDRGSVQLFANYLDQGGNFRGDFDFIADRDADNASGIGNVFSSGTGSPGRFNLAVPGDDGAFVRSGSPVEDPDCEAAGGELRDGTRCRYPFIDQRRLIAEEERFQVFGQYDYELSDRLVTSGEISFSRNEIRDAIGGAVLRRTTTDGGFFVPGDNPFNFFVEDGEGGITYAGPEAFANDPDLEGADLIFRGRPLGRAFDGDNAEDIITIFDNLRFSAALDYEVSDSVFATVSYTNSANRYTRSQPRDYDAEAFQAAIISGAWNPFGSSLATPDLVSPRDGVSVAGNTPEDLSLFSLTVNDNGEVTQEVIEGIVSWDTGYELLGGTIALAVGAQYRDLTFENIPDSRRQNGTNARAETEGIIRGQQDAYAVFGEIIVPFTERFEVQAALRFEDYGDQGGDTVDPKVAAKFDVTDWLALRGSWGTSFQAPSIRQVAGSVGAAGVDDPADPTAGNFNVTVFTEGSDDLESQSAENLNLGVVVRQGGLDLSVDYWTYEYEGLILPGGSPQAIIDQVFAGELPADRVVRDESGQINAVRTGFLNRGTATAEGFDIAAIYRPESWAYGDLVLDATTTVITEFESDEFAGLDGDGDLRGSRNFGNGFGSAPDFKLNLGATLTTGVHLANVSVRHIGEYEDDQSGEPIDGQTTVDARYAIDISEFIGGTDTVLSIGAVNLFDEDPSPLENRPLFDTEVFDPRGRQLYATFRKAF